MSQICSKKTDKKLLNKITSGLNFLANLKKRAVKTKKLLIRDMLL